MTPMMSWLKTTEDTLPIQKQLRKNKWLTVLFKTCLQILSIKKPIVDFFKHIRKENVTVIDENILEKQILLKFTIYTTYKCS